MPGEFHGERSLVSYNPWGCKELDLTELWSDSFTPLLLWDFPGGSEDKASAYNAGNPGSIPGRKISWRRKWQPTPVFLPGKSHGQRSLVGYSPWGCRVRHDWATSLSFFLLFTFTLEFGVVIIYVNLKNKLTQSLNL